MPLCEYLLRRAMYFPKQAQLLVWSFIPHRCAIGNLWTNRTTPTSWLKTCFLDHVPLSSFPANCGSVGHCGHLSTNNTPLVPILALRVHSKGHSIDSTMRSHQSPLLYCEGHGEIPPFLSSRMLGVMMTRQGKLLQRRKDLFCLRGSKVLVMAGALGWWRF